MEKPKNWRSLGHYLSGIGGPIGEADKLRTVSMTGGRPVRRRPPAEFAGVMQTYQLE